MELDYKDDEKSFEDLIKEKEAEISELKRKQQKQNSKETPEQSDKSTTKIALSKKFFTLGWFSKSKSEFSFFPFLFCEWHSHEPYYTCHS